METLADKTIEGNSKLLESLGGAEFLSTSKEGYLTHQEIKYNLQSCDDDCYGICDTCDCVCDQCDWDGPDCYGGI